MLLRLSGHYTTADMQHGLPGSFIRLGHLTWSQVKILNWPIGVKMHKFRCVSTRGTFWLKVKMLCKLLKSDMFGFRASKTLHSALSRGSIAITVQIFFLGGEVLSKMVKYRAWARVRGSRWNCWMSPITWLWRWWVFKHAVRWPFVWWCWWWVNVLSLNFNFHDFWLK